jgi:hypothetical protein
MIVLTNRPGDNEAVVLELLGPWLGLGRIRTLTVTVTEGGAGPSDSDLAGRCGPGRVSTYSMIYDIPDVILVDIS